MIITELTPVGKTKQKVFIDYEYAFLLMNRDIRQYGIEMEREIAPSIVEEIYSEIVLPKAKLKAMDILKSCDRTEYELLNKLKTAGFSTEMSNEALQYVKKYNYINDYRFTCNYINFRKSAKSLKMITLELSRKGIDKSMIHDAIEAEYQEDMEETAIRREILKKCSNVEELSFEKRMKLSASLFRKGYSSSLVRKVLGDLENEQSLLE